MDESTRRATRFWTLAQPAVSAFVTSVVRDFRDRDDVLQDIAVAVVESFNSYDSARPFTAWAMGVARNQVGLYLRRRRRDRLVFDDETVGQLATAFAEVGPDQSNKLDFLHDCLQSLEGRARRLLELRYGNDFKPAAIAEQLSMTANTVAKALQRLRDQLRTCIERKTVVEGVVP
jgi:RNA polymerase sigma-70 factor (ECF subfamily)